CVIEAGKPVTPPGDGHSPIPSERDQARPGAATSRTGSTARSCNAAGRRSRPDAGGARPSTARRGDESYREYGEELQRRRATVTARCRRSETKHGQARRRVVPGVRRGAATPPGDGHGPTEATCWAEASDAGRASPP